MTSSSESSEPVPTTKPIRRRSATITSDVAAVATPKKTSSVKAKTTTTTTRKTRSPAAPKEPKLEEKLVTVDILEFPTKETFVYYPEIKIPEIKQNPLAKGKITDLLYKLNYFDTGFAAGSVGLISYRSFAGYDQIVYQIEPGIQTTFFSTYEGDSKRQRQVAYPYRIVILDYAQENLVGARVFFSPVPCGLDTILCYPNLPNINCRQYGHGVGLGWVCLYLTGYKKNAAGHMPKTLSEKIQFDLDRATRAESYNNNMSSIDGFAAYKHHSVHKFLSSETQLETYTKEHGFNWTTDPAYWLPIVLDAKTKTGNSSDLAIGDWTVYKDLSQVDPSRFLTLRDAMYLPYKAYYYDNMGNKPFNWDRKNLTSDQVSYLVKFFTNSFQSKPSN